MVFIPPRTSLSAANGDNAARCHSSSDQTESALEKFGSMSSANTAVGVFDTSEKLREAIDELRFDRVELSLPADEKTVGEKLGQNIGRSLT